MLPKHVDGVADFDKNFSCYGNGWVTGIYGNYGTYVDRFGVVCGLPPTQGGSSPAVDPQVQQACEGYASRMDARISEARNLNCAFLSGSGGWNEPRAHWLKQCIGWKAGSSTKVNEDGLQRNVDSCKSGQGGGGGGGTTVKVLAEVTMYDTYEDGNQDLCYLQPDDTLTKLSLGGAKAPWMHLKGNSGNCSGKTGYVSNEGELQ